MLIRKSAEISSINTKMTSSMFSKFVSVTIYKLYTTHYSVEKRRGKLKFDVKSFCEKIGFLLSRLFNMI